MILNVAKVTREAVFVLSGTHDNSPPFQRWAMRCNNNKYVPVP